MNILLVTLGSHGDVHPFVGIGRALQRRGHSVTILTNPYFEPLIRSAGLRFEGLSTAEMFCRWTDDPDIWHPQRGPQRVMAGVGETIREAYGRVVEIHARFDAVVGSSLSLGALVAAEQIGFPYATAHLSPICLRSLHQLPTLAGGINFSRFPMWFKRGFWNGADKWFIDPMIAPPLNELRADLGLPPVSSVIGHYWNAPRLTIGLWPSWFAAVQPDHPPQLRLAGFPLYDEADVTPLDESLDNWLHDGPPPIAFTPGSAMKHGRRFFEVAVDACAKIGCRALLLTRHPEQLPPLPSHAKHVAYAPFSKLLPRVATLVHHGGIGTTAQCLRAGTPQLIMPMSHDQPDNAARCKKLGVADSISRSMFRPRAVAKKLRRLIDDASVRSNCQAVAAKFAGHDALETACLLIESLTAASPLAVAGRA